MIGVANKETHYSDGAEYVLVTYTSLVAIAIQNANLYAQLKAAVPFEIQSDVCIGCGECAAVCPTDAIRIEDVNGQRVLRTWNTMVTLHTCPSCGEPFAPEPMAFLRELVEVSGELWGMCPEAVIE